MTENWEKGINLFSPKFRLCSVWKTWRNFADFQNSKSWLAILFITIFLFRVYSIISFHKCSCSSKKIFKIIQVNECSIGGMTELIFSKCTFNCKKEEKNLDYTCSFENALIWWLPVVILVTICYNIYMIHIFFIYCTYKPTNRRNETFNPIFFLILSLLLFTSSSWSLFCLRLYC